MNAKVAVAEFGAGSEAGNGGELQEARSRLAPQHLPREMRIRFYRGVEALLAAGIGLAMARELLVSEYRAAGPRTRAEAVRSFLDGLVEVRSKTPGVLQGGARVAELASMAFGKDFAGPEEMAALKAMASADPSGLPAAFRGAAELAELAGRRG